MSTKMHNFVIQKAGLWAALENLRDEAFYESPLAQMARLVMWTHYYNGMKRMDAWDKLRHDHRGADWEIELQVFDMARAPVMGSENLWMLRPLERGWWLYERMRANPAFTPVTYNDSTDVPPEEEKNLGLARWLDEEITARNYFVHSVVNRDQYAIEMFNLHWRPDMRRRGG